MNKIKQEDDELISYFIINKDLNMSAGKIAVQVAHAMTIQSCDIILQNNGVSKEKFLEWYTKSNQKKIVLMAHEKDLIKLLQKCDKFYEVRDIGLTEVAPNSLTCVGLPIMTRKEAKKYVHRLQLLR